jgi:hypothetical protein
MNILIFLFVFLLKPNAFYRMWTMLIVNYQAKAWDCCVKKQKKNMFKYCSEKQNLESSGILWGNMQLKYSP